MSGDWDTAAAGVGSPQQKAGMQINGVQNVQPAAAAQAYKDAPVSGVPPAIGMQNPDIGQQAAKRVIDQAALAHPAVANFVATSPVHAAVAQDDLPKLGGIADAAKGFVDNFLAPFKQANQTLEEAQVEHPTTIQGGIAAGAKLLLGSVQLGLAPITGAFNTVIDPLAGALAKYASFVPPTFLPGQVPTSSKENYKDILGFGSMFLGGGEAGAAIDDGRIMGGGKPPTDALGLHLTNDKGFVTDANRQAYVFNNPGKAAVWAKANLKDTGQDFSLYTEQGFTGIKAENPEFAQEPLNVTPKKEEEPLPGETSKVDEVLAETHAEQAKSLSTLVAESDTFKHSPELMKEYLDQQGLGEQTVYVNPEAISKLAETGTPREELPFIQNHESDIISGIASKQDVAVPLSEYLTEIAGKPWAEQIIRTTSFAPGLNSVAEQPKEEDLFASSTLPGTFYHGTGASFENFQNPAEQGGVKPGIFFSDSPHFANDYTPEEGGNIRPVNLAVKNPLQVESIHDLELQDAWDKGHDAVIASKTDFGGRGNIVAVKDPSQIRSIFEQKKTEVPKSVPEKYLAPVQSVAARVDRAVDVIFKELYLDKIASGNKALEMTKPQYERHSNALEEAHEIAREKILDKIYSAIKKERTPEWKAAVELYREEAEKELRARPDIQALQTFKDFKIDKDIVKQSYSEIANKLPDNIQGNTGIHPDQAADLAGYSSGESLLSDLGFLHQAVTDSGAKNLEGFIKQRAKDLAAGRAEADLGFNLSPEDIERAAQEAAVLPQISDLLISQLKDLGREIGLPFNVGDIKVKAQELFQEKTMQEALNIKSFEKGMKRSGEAVEAALQKGKAIEAFQAKQAQLISHYQLAESHNLRKQFQKDGRLLVQAGKKSFYDKVDPQFAAVIQQAVRDLHMPVSIDPITLQRFLQQSPFPNTAALIQHLDDVGVPVKYATVPSDLAGANGKLPLKMQVGNFSDYMEMVRGLTETGKQIHQLIIGEEKAELDHIANQVEANAGGIGRKFTPQELVDSRRHWWNRAARTMDSIVADNLRPEIPLHWIDGDKQGPLMHHVVNPLMYSKHLETDLTQAWIKAMKEYPGAKEVMGSMSQGLTAPDSMDVQTPHGPVKVIKNRGELRRALAHLGSVTARTKMLQGFGWGDDAERWMLANATTQDWSFVKAFWKENEKLFQLTDKMYMDLRGYGLKKDEPRAVDTGNPDHKVLAGGHIHLEYNQQLKDLTKVRQIESGDLVSQDKANSSAPDLMADHPASTLTSAFYALNRTNYIGPVELDWHRLTSGVAEVIHDIAFRPSLVNAQKALTDPRIKNAIASVLGPTYVKQLMPWLRYIAQERMFYDPATDDAAKAVQLLRNNMVWSMVAYNLSSLIKHSGVGLAHMSTESDNPIGLLKAAADLTGVGEKAQAWRQFVHDNSGEVRGLLWTLDNSLRDALGKDVLGMSGFDKYKKLGFASFAISKMLEAHVTWLDKYRSTVNKTDDHQLAVDTADKAVRDTQGAGAPTDVPPLFRHSGSAMHQVGLMLTSLMSFRGTSFNRGWTILRQYGLGARQLAAGDTGAGASNFGKATKAGTGFFLLAALWLAYYGTQIRGEGDKKKSAQENMENDFLWELAGQGPGSAIGGNLAFDAAHFAKSGGGGDMLSEYAENLMKTGDISQHKETQLVLGMFGQTIGLIPTSGAHLGQEGMNLLHPDWLKPEEQNPAATAQRVLLNRTGAYNPKSSSKTRSRGR